MGKLPDGPSSHSAGPCSERSGAICDTNKPDVTLSTIGQSQYRTNQTKQGRTSPCPPSPPRCAKWLRRSGIGYATPAKRGGPFMPVQPRHALDLANLVPVQVTCPYLTSITGRLPPANLITFRLTTSSAVLQRHHVSGCPCGSVTECRQGRSQGAFRSRCQGPCQLLQRRNSRVIAARNIRRDGDLVVSLGTQG
jgi:hypothetical protein